MFYVLYQGFNTSSKKKQLHVVLITATPIIIRHDNTVRHEMIQTFTCPVLYWNSHILLNCLSPHLLILLTYSLMNVSKMKY